MGLRKTFRRSIRSLTKAISGNSLELELGRISDFKHLTPGYANVFDKPFKFHHGPSFVESYREIFQTNIYEFRPSVGSNIILDCGANMGLSVLYFATKYPAHQVIAFEPDARIFSILQENVTTFQLKNVTLHQKAVWTQQEKLTFYTDGGMGGRVDHKYAGQEPYEVEAVPLLDYLTSGVDFLKIDIEGAETTVLKYCGNQLVNANHIFFEYHNDIDSEQTLHDLLALVKCLGFHYYIKESSTRRRPFVDTDLVCEAFDMAINVFCYKEQIKELGSPKKLSEK